MKTIDTIEDLCTQLRYKVIAEKRFMVTYSHKHGILCPVRFFEHERDAFEYTDHLLKCGFEGIKVTDQNLFNN